MYTILYLSRFMLMVSVLDLEYKGFVQDSRISEEIRQTFEQLIPFRIVLKDFFKKHKSELTVAGSPP